MLTTAIAQIEGVHVVSSAQIEDLLAPQDPANASLAWYLQAARRAKATTLFDGVIYPVAAEVRLDLRRIDVASGDVMTAWSARGPELGALVDSLTRRVSPELAPTPPAE